MPRLSELIFILKYSGIREADKNELVQQYGIVSCPKYFACQLRCDVNIVNNDNNPLPPPNQKKVKVIP